MAPSLSFIGLSLEKQPQGGSKFTAFTLVSDEGLSQGIKGNDWVNAVLSVYGGRGGGRPNAAQGSAFITLEQEVTASDKITTLAKQYLKSLSIQVN